MPSGRIILRGSAAAYVGPALDLAPHRCAVATIAAALEGAFDLAVFDAGGSPQPFLSVPAAVIAPGMRHHLVATGPMAFVYLDAASADWTALAELEPAHLRARVLDRLADPDPSAMLRLLDGPARRDPRVEYVLRLLDDDPDAVRAIQDAGLRVGLSPSRLQTLLRAQVGIPFRRYRLWRRMAQVLRFVRAGGSLTDAAHAAGFASSAHFSTAFRRMFGLAPSRLLTGAIALDLDA